MNTEDFPPDVMKGAYRIFVEEARRHVNEVVAPLAMGGADLDSVRDATVKVHRIRGGAGFFGLSDVELAAKNLERLLKESEDVMNRQLGEVQELVSALARRVEELPDPESSVK